MFAPQPIHDTVYGLGMLTPDCLAGSRSWLRDIAVHVPLDEVDGVLAQQVIQSVIDGRNYLRSPEVQDKLPAGFGARAAGEVQHPVRMLAVQVGVRD